jgi:hypothetical protein
MVKSFSINVSQGKSHKPIGKDIMIEKHNTRKIIL